jgi:hypothetical protein
MGSTLVKRTMGLAMLLELCCKSLKLVGETQIIFFVAHFWFTIMTIFCITVFTLFKIYFPFNHTSLLYFSVVPLIPVPIVVAETASYVNVSFTNYDDKDSSRLPDKVLARIVEVTEDQEIDEPDLEEKLENETPREYDYSGTENGGKTMGWHSAARPMD